MKEFLKKLWDNVVKNPFTSVAGLIILGFGTFRYLRMGSDVNEYVAEVTIGLTLLGVADPDMLKVGK
jgi:hypothetical protein